MIKLSCKAMSCLQKDHQSLEGCYDCHYLETTDDLVLYTVDKSEVKQPLEGWTNELSDEKNVEQLSKLAKDKLDQIKNPDKAARFNEGKPKWSLVHFKSLEPMIRVLEFGALKYAPKNWQKPMDTLQILESMQRHLAALFDGEEVDSESGISHMGHIMCNALFYNYHKERLKNEGEGKV